MKPSEKVFLDTLRKTTLAYLSESDYAQIEKAVEQKGILNLTGTTSILVKSAVQKHEGGGHDQASHGSWAEGGMGGASMADIAESMSELDEEEAEGKNNISAKRTNEFVGGSYHRVDIKTTPNTLDKLLGKGEEIMGDKYERKVTEQWSAEFTDKSTGKSFRAAVYDYMRYDEKGLTAEQGQKIPLLSRGESHSFHIGADSKEQAEIVRDYISASHTSGVNKVSTLKKKLK